MFLPAVCVIQIVPLLARKQGVHKLLVQGHVVEEDHRKPTIPLNIKGVKLLVNVLG